MEGVILYPMFNCITIYDQISELPIQSSNVDVESIPDSCPVEDGKSVSLETSQE